MANRIAIIPGSFDPITLGHLDIIKRATKLFDKVIVAVMINPDKNYMYSMEQRTQLAMLATADVENVEVIPSTGMLWELARDLNACAIVKGVRNFVDVDYEMKMAKFNLAHCPEIETIFLPASSELAEVSSSRVRFLINHNMITADIIPEIVSDTIKTF